MCLIRIRDRSCVWASAFLPTADLTATHDRPFTPQLLKRPVQFFKGFEEETCERFIVASVTHVGTVVFISLVILAGLSYLVVVCLHALLHFVYGSHSLRVLILCDGVGSGGEDDSGYRRAFDALDVDGSETVSLDELVGMLVASGMPKREVRAAFRRADRNRDGHIDFDEFVQMFRDATAPQQGKLALWSELARLKHWLL